MKLSIVDKSKKEIFISLFQVLKNCSNIVNISFNQDGMYIQGIDKSHVCLFELKIIKNWFQEYAVETPQNICVDTSILHHVLSITHDNQLIYIYTKEDDEEHINIDLKFKETETNSKPEYNKFFTIPLCELESELMAIPDTDYDVDFSMPAKKMQEITSQLMFFGDVMNIECTEEKISLGSNGQNGSMNVLIPIDDLSEYSIADTTLVSYSLNYVHKMCLTTKIATEVAFSVSKDYPVRIKYAIDLNSHLVFYLAPKMSDNDN